MNDIFEPLKGLLPERYLNRECLQRFRYDDILFYRLKKDLKGYPRGTVFWQGGMLHGFQRIKRVLNLAEGIRRHFPGRFYLEEKMDGYNVRIKRINSRLFAFTRGGYVCPFTMDRLDELVRGEFFDRYPDYTLCGEVVGPENPYNSEPVDYIDEDIMFFAFDIKDREGRSLPLTERYSIFRETGIQAVRRWGPYTSSDIDMIKSVITELDQQGREGVVIKSADSEIELKYVTLGSCIRDIKATAALFPELPGGFYMQRLIRILAMADEFGIQLDEETKLTILDSLLGPMMKTIEHLRRGDQLKEFFRIRVNRKETIDALIRHLKSIGMNARVVSVERAGRHYLVTFYRIYTRGARIMRKRLTGQGFYD